MISVTQRRVCGLCLRPQSTCICQWVRPTDHVVEVWVLQHPMEEHHAKGSARLLHLGLPGSVLLAGEVFDPDTLSALLYDGGRTPLLLYPDSIAQAASDPSALPALPAARALLAALAAPVLAVVLTVFPPPGTSAIRCS